MAPQLCVRGILRQQSRHPSLLALYSRSLATDCAVSAAREGALTPHARSHLPTRRNNKTVRSERCKPMRMLLEGVRMAEDGCQTQSTCRTRRQGTTYSVHGALGLRVRVFDFRTVA
eukprot:1369221-Rhodomonas_salina.1